MPPFFPGPDSGSDFESDAELRRALVAEPTVDELAVVEDIGAAELASMNAPERPQGLWSSAERLAERVRVSEALTRKAQAHMLRDVDALVTQLLAHDLAFAGRERSEAMEFATDEVAAALEVSRRTAQVRMDDAMVLVRELPRTLAALEAGLISYPVARALAGETRLLPGEQRTEIAAEVESRVLDHVGRGELDGLGRMTPAQIVLSPVLQPEKAWRVGLGLTAGRVRKLARTAATALCAEVVVPEPSAACGDVEAYPAGPGLMYLGARMLEADGLVALARIDALARQLRTLPGETRSMPELRLQAHSDLLVGRPGGAAASDCRGPSAGDPPGTTPVPFDVRLTVDRDGLPSSPRYGALSAEVLEQVLAMAVGAGGRIRVGLVEPAACPGDHAADGPGPYRPSDALAASMWMRDRTCRFPGCTVPAGRCDIDHSIPYPRGPTCACNLACLCRHHHRLKTLGRWQLTNHGEGHLTWTTSSGRTIDTWPAL